MPYEINLFDESRIPIKKKTLPKNRLLSVDNLHEADEYLDSLDTDNYISLAHG